MSAHTHTGKGSIDWNMMYPLQNILDIPANNCQLQALVSTPTHLSVHKCGCIQDYGRTVEILLISIHKVFFM